MDPNTFPTKGNLILAKNSLKLSRQGYELMDKKRNILIREMMELIESGYPNIICAQPFGCLPNHIVGKGMIRNLKNLYPRSNIVPIDYDPGATKVNQENRIKLMLAVAKENMESAE